MGFRDEPTKGERAAELQELLRRLGEALHGAVTDADEVQRCLEELHSSGWEAVMMLEAAVACRPGSGTEVTEATLHVHADPSPPSVSYRLSRGDLGFLTGIGISPSRHRSTPRPPRSDG